MPGSDLDFEAPRQLVAGGMPSPSLGTSYDTAKDGRLIMSNAQVGTANASRAAVTVVLDWFDVVRERAPRR